MNREIKHWIIPHSPKVFNLDLIFQNRDFVDWHKTVNYKIGDIVYIYSSKPIGKIKYKCVVIKENIDIEDLSDDKKYYLNGYNENTFTSRGWARLQLLNSLENDLLCYRILKEIGIKSQLQGALGNITKNQIDYIENIFKKIK